MISSFYEGWIRRRRYRPAASVLRVPVSFLYLDLEEAPSVFAGVLLWSLERPALARLDRKDHFGDPALTLDESVRRFVFESLGRPVDGPIRILTQLRTWGFSRPLAGAYYCFTEEGPLDAVLVSLDRLPGVEPMRFVLDANKAQRDHRRLSWAESPGQPGEWNLGVPGTEILWHFSRGGKDSAFDATLSLQRRSLEAASFLKSLVTQPLRAARLSLTLS